MTSFEECPVVSENVLVLQKRKSTPKMHIHGILANTYSV
jgi:hypothetical protein